VTSNKYVHTPQGVFELKFFFNSSIRPRPTRTSRPRASSRPSRRSSEIEDPRNPHSDQKIVEILAQGDIIIARRTVAKYREMLGILSSAQRKKYALCRPEGRVQLEGLVTALAAVPPSTSGGSDGGLVHVPQRRVVGGGNEF
jgi:hypothetical protein